MKSKLFALAIMSSLFTNLAWAIGNFPEDPCFVFMCMAGKLQGNTLTSGVDCIAGRQSFFNKRVYTPEGYDPDATSIMRKAFLSLCVIGLENRLTLELIIQRYGASFEEL